MREEPVGWIWVILFLILSVLGIWWVAGPLDASEAPCPEGFVHVMPYCMTPDEYTDWLTPDPPPLPPKVPPLPTGVERWRPIIEHFWDEPHTSRMLRIMACESKGDPGAYNGRTGVAGLFQIHPLWQKPWPGDYYDPWTNAAVAYQVWLEQGYRAWACK